MNKYLPQELQNYKEFISKTNKELAALGVELSDLTVDHIAYQASSSEEYEGLVRKCKQIGKVLSESVVGGRRVGVIELDERLTFEDQEFVVLEIVEPKEGQEVTAGLEHVEYTVRGTLEDLIEKYPDIDWDTKVINRAEFPMLVLKLSSGTRAKFPRRGVVVELERQAGD